MPVPIVLVLTFFTLKAMENCKYSTTYLATLCGFEADQTAPWQSRDSTTELVEDVLLLDALT